MTYDEFLQKLRETPRKWVLWGENQEIVLADDASFCPYVVVDGAETLPKQLAYEVWNASDGVASASPEIRRDLLAACGLQEQA